MVLGPHQGTGEHVQSISASSFLAVPPFTTGIKKKKEKKKNYEKGKVVGDYAGQSSFFSSFRKRGRRTLLGREGRKRERAR